MGFDLHGMAPKTNKPEPAILQQYNWSSVPEKSKDEYWKASNKHEADNPGVYFRNNVWWWRPLWTYVSTVCNDILTENDITRGSYNDGAKISKTKAVKIAKRILMENENGNLDKYAQKYKADIEALGKVECTICDGVGMRTPPLLDMEGNTNDQSTLQKCNGCGGTGKRESWAASYPFSVDNVLEFAKFAKESGGFQIY